MTTNLPYSKTFSVSNIIIAITLVVFMAQDLIPSLSLLLGLNVMFFKYHLYYQPLSTMFIHGGIAHVLMNMFILFQFGNMIEYAIGKLRFIALYFLGGIFTSFGTLAYMYYTNSWVNVIGASGAICVLLGWYALRVKEERKGIVIWVALISFLPLLLGLPVAWYAHLIGFIIGLVLGVII